MAKTKDKYTVKKGKEGVIVGYSKGQVVLGKATQQQLAELFAENHPYVLKNETTEQPTPTDENAA